MQLVDGGGGVDMEQARRGGQAAGRRHARAGAGAESAHLGHGVLGEQQHVHLAAGQGAAHGREDDGEDADRGRDGAVAADHGEVVEDAALDDGDHVAHHAPDVVHVAGVHGDGGGDGEEVVGHHLRAGHHQRRVRGGGGRRGEVAVVAQVSWGGKDVKIRITSKTS